MLARRAPAEERARSFLGKILILRIHENLVPMEEYGTTRVAHVRMSGDEIEIGGESFFLGKAFVSRNSYQIEGVKLRKERDALELKARAVRIASIGQPGMTLKLYFFGLHRLRAEDFDQMFFSVFFRENEDVGEYIRLNDEKLVERYLNPHQEFAVLAFEERLRILLRIHELDAREPIPRLERISDRRVDDPKASTNERLFVHVHLPIDLSEYNDLRVSRNERIASTIEFNLPAMKAKAFLARSLQGIHGLHFAWSVAHRDFLSETFPSYDKVDFYVPLTALAELADGLLSPFELINASLLQVNGTKVTLGLYEPIR